jgi:8-oxo-dGTP diphosphatase
VRFPPEQGIIPGMPRPVRAAAIVLKDHHLLLLYRKKKGREYWLFPGGSVENHETLRRAAIRELFEEASITATVIRLFYLAKNVRRREYFFLCRYGSGTPLLGDADEKEKMRSGKDYYEPQWIAVDRLLDIKLYPTELRDRLAKYLGI